LPFEIKTRSDGMYSCLTTLFLREKKGVHGPRKLVMEMSNILTLDNRLEIRKNIPLFTLLFKQCGTNEKRQDALEQLVLDYIVGQNEAGAMEILPLLWPNLLEGILLKDLEGVTLNCVKEGKDTFTLYSVKLSKVGATRLDEALVKYSKRLDYLVLNTFTRLKTGDPVPETFFEYASREKLRAGHLMSDTNHSAESFSSTLGHLIGYHYPAESCGLMKKAPRILRESLQNLPEREGHFIAKNLLVYLAAIKDRLESEDERDQCNAIEEMSRVVSIALCHNMATWDVRGVFLDAAKKIKV